MSEDAEGARAAEGEGEEEERSLEDRLRRLEEIVRRLEGGDVELEEGLALFEEGVGHLRAAERILSRAELRIEELVGEGTDLELETLRGSEAEA